jgi:hypothetical protein
MARKPKNPINDIMDTVGVWLGGRGPGTNPQVQAAMQATRAIARTADTATGGFGQALISDAQRMARSGSSTPSALYKTAAVNLGAAATGVGAAKVAGKAAQTVRRNTNPFYDAVQAARANPARGFVQGTASAEDLMKLRSVDRYGISGSRVKTPPRIIEDTEHLANIRKQNASAYEYENRVRMYSDDDLSKYSNLSEDIKDRGIQSPVMVGRFKGKPTLMEGNHRVIAQFDLNPKTQVPFQVSKNTWDDTNKFTKQVSRRAALKTVKQTVKKVVPKKR